MAIIWINSGLPAKATDDNDAPRSNAANVIEQTFGRILSKAGQMELPHEQGGSPGLRGNVKGTHSTITRMVYGTVIGASAGGALGLGYNQVVRVIRHPEWQTDQPIGSRVIVGISLGSALGAILAFLTASLSPLQTAANLAGMVKLVEEGRS
ncbi:MAG: hypothetical protein LBI20_03200 [Holosporales bacterium]|nr:hypothetical protein [Holosporales bacterium]